MIKHLIKRRYIKKIKNKKQKNIIKYSNMNLLFGQIILTGHYWHLTLFQKRNLYNVCN